MPEESANPQNPSSEELHEAASAPASDAAPVLEKLTKDDLALIKQDPKKGPIADRLQKLIVKLLKGHRISVERSKEMARHTLILLRDAQDALAVDNALKASSKMYPEITPLFYTIEEGEKREVDIDTADQVIEKISSGDYEGAVNLGNKICHFFHENPEGDVHQLMSHFGHHAERVDHPDATEESA